MREDENERNEEQTATCCCHDIRTYRLADGLHQHICQHDGGYQREADNLPLQGNRTHCYHAGIITEEFDDRFGEKEAENGTNRQKYRAAFDAEKERTFCRVVIKMKKCRKKELSILTFE